jgi:hypothetical protein
MVMLRLVAEAGSVLVMIAAWALAIGEYPSLPARFPTHFGIDGRPDAWGTKRTLWIFPAVMVALSLMDAWVMNLVARDPRHPGMVVGIAWLNCEMLALFLYIEARSITVARGRAAGLGAAFLPLTIAVIVATSLLLVRG